MPEIQCKAIAIGASSGGTKALGTILRALPAGFSLPILAVLHRHPTDRGLLTTLFDSESRLTVEEAGDKAPIRTGHVYIAPADYHLLVEHDETTALSIDPKVHFSRPAIDVLFDSAAYVWGPQLLGIVLTGANEDGADGARIIKERGGRVFVQDPASAEQATMPAAAIAATQVDAVLTIDQLIRELIRLHEAAPG